MLTNKGKFKIIYFLAFTISRNSGFREAPPTKNPSISGFFASSAALDPLTDPVENKKKKKIFKKLFIYLKNQKL